LGQPAGIVVDSSGRLIVSNFSPAQITVYANAATVNGNVVPSSIVGGGNTTLSGPNQIVLNPSVGTGDLYVADPFAGQVAVFANAGTANGNIAPARRIFGSSTSLATTPGVATARGVALDTTR
jgi:hypothetical protein